MKLEYKFVTGDKVFIDVDKELYDIIFEFDEEWRKSYRRESSNERHNRLDDLNDKSECLKDLENLDVDEQAFKNLNKDKLYAAISKLKSAEQELLYHLFLKKNFITQAAYAKILEITENAVRKRFSKIKLKLKDLL